MTESDLDLNSKPAEDLDDREHLNWSNEDPVRNLLGSVKDMRNPVDFVEDNSEVAAGGVAGQCFRWEFGDLHSQDQVRIH